MPLSCPASARFMSLGRHVLPLLSLVLSLALPAAAGPQVEARSGRIGRKSVGVLLINRRTAAHLFTANAGLSAAERAQTAAARLEAHLAAGKRPSVIRARAEGSRWRVTVGETVLLHATRAEARAHGTTPRALANRWATAMRRLLTLPPVTLSASRLVIPLGETRVLAIGGYAEGGWQVDAPVGADVVEPALSGRRVVVRALSVGTAQVTVSAEGRTARCFVAVKKYAGALRSLVDADVTGDPAPATLQNAAAALAVRRFLPREPGAQVTLLDAPRLHRALPPGQTVTVSVPVRVAGGGHLPVQGTARIRVRNRRLPQREGGRLLYSNVPERIQRHGTLFVGALQYDEPTRLFYHHVNNLRAPVALAVTLVNPGPEPVTLQIIPGFVSPDPNAVRAGYLAGRAFLRRYQQNIGEIYTLPARSSVPLAIDRLKPEETGSGIAQVRLLAPSDARCMVRVAAEPWSQPTWPRSAAGHTDVWRRVLPRPATATETADAALSADVFVTPVKQVQAEYVVGKPWAWIQVGKEPITSASGERRLAGNYGVVYQIQVKIQNPTPERRRVQVAFEAGAGLACGVFTVAGRYVEAPNVQAREERPLAHFDLAPNETRTISIETVPLGGSSYPAAFIIR